MKVKFDSSKKHPPYGGLKSPLPQVMSTLELDGYGWQSKNPLPFNITWIGFRWCESRDSLNFMAFSSEFLVAPIHPAHSLTSSCFGILKVFRRYISGLSFIYFWFVVLKFWNFKCFHTSRKFNFRLLLVGCSDATHWYVVKFVWNFDQWCNAS